MAFQHALPVLLCTWKEGTGGGHDIQSQERALLVNVGVVNVCVVNACAVNVCVVNVCVAQRSVLEDKFGWLSSRTILMCYTY